MVRLCFPFCIQTPGLGRLKRPLMERGRLVRFQSTASPRGLQDRLTPFPHPGTDAPERGFFHWSQLAVHCQASTSWPLGVWESCAPLCPLSTHHQFFVASSRLGDPLCRPLQQIGMSNKNNILRSSLPRFVPDTATRDCQRERDPPLVSGPWR